jgi:ferredoxin
MEKAELYEALAKHLDQGIMGAPRSEALTGILEVLFPVEEAEVARKVSMQNQTLSVWKKAFPERPDTEAILNRMAQRGTAFTSQKSGKDGVAHAEPARCIGCGVCTPTCSGDAVDLVLRGEMQPPPQIQEFPAARWKRP